LKQLVNFYYHHAQQSAAKNISQRPAQAMTISRLED